MSEYALIGAATEEGQWHLLQDYCLGLHCRDQEGRRGSEEAVPGPSVFPSGEPGVSGMDLDYRDIEWFALETNREIILLFLRLHPSTASQTLLLTMMATPFLLRDFCLQ